MSRPARSAPKGSAKRAFASVAASISNAIYNAIGIRFTELPLTPEVVLKADQGKRDQINKLCITCF